MGQKFVKRKQVNDVFPLLTGGFSKRDTPSTMIIQIVATYINYSTVIILLQESCILFSCLYRCWCHNPVATVSLCLLAQTYKHACDLLLNLYPFNLNSQHISKSILLNTSVHVLHISVLTDSFH